MAMDPNQIVEISGWVRVDRPFAGGEGLEIVDSLGGPGLSLVVGQTFSWKPFRMIRSSAEASKFRITFALAGLGSAKMDAVMVRLLEPSGIRRLRRRLLRLLRRARGTCGLYFGRSCDAIMVVVRRQVMPPNLRFVGAVVT